MTDPRYDLLRRLFDEVVELPVAARAAFVDARCAADPDLRERLHALLRAADDEHFLRSPTLASGGSDAPPAAADVAVVGEGPGTRIGPYLLLEQIGEGGFGAVFLAEQKVPVARRVALKVVKLGMCTRQVVARFEQERQALAVMDHPNIARVLDAGVTATGRPYFVMDLVQGVPMTDYCDRENLPIDARLALFTQVCEAVQHAHQKGIVHRDLKPSNVLVGTIDGRAVAKVIDFGIAKATSVRLTAATFRTEQRQVIGTLQYMSPEQAEASTDVDTRSDVYSLGVLLYELLTGSTPCEASTVENVVFDEILRRIREVDPPRPSTRLGESRDTIAGIAARRRIEPKRLGTVLRGDLDWIVMRALEKDRTRRYQSPHDLAEDLRRHRDGVAVVAAPPSAVYRLRKFVRRNRGLVAATVAVAGSLVGGVVAFAWQARITGVERDKAVVARTNADERAMQLTMTVEFQERMLGQIDTTAAGRRLMHDIRDRHAAALGKGEGTDAERLARAERFAQDLAEVNATDTAVAIVDSTILAPAVVAVGSQFADQPLVAATLRQTLAAVYRQLGRFAVAEQLQRLTLDARERLLGARHADTLSACNDLADVLDQQGRFAEAESWHRRAADGRSAVLGAEHPDTLRSRGNLGGNLRYQGKLAEAEPILRDALEATRRVLGDEHRDTLVRRNTLGYVLVDQGRTSAAEPHWREAYETGKRVFGADDRDVIVWTNNFAGLLQALGRESEAEGLYREALASSQRVRGHEHPDTAMLVQNVANSLQAQKRHAEAETFAREALAVRRRVLGDDHPDTLGSMTGLGSALRDQGKMAEAEPYLRTAFAALERTVGKDNPQTLRGGTTLATFLNDAGEAAAAEALYRDLLARSAPVWGENHTDRLLLQQLLGNLLVQQRRFPEAEPMLRDTLVRQRAVSGDEHPDTLLVQCTLASLYASQGRFPAAEADYRDAVAKMRRVLGDEHATTLIMISNWAQVLLKLERFADAEPLLREAAAGLDAVYGNRHGRAIVARSCLGRALLGLRRFAEAEVAFAAALAAAAEGDLSRRKAYTALLVTLHEAWHAAEPAAGHDRDAASWRTKLEALAAPAGK